MKNYLTRNFFPYGDLFDETFGNFLKPIFYDNKIDVMKTDVKEEDGNYTLEIELPGFSKENINLELDNGYLTISAKMVEAKEDDKKKYIRRERSYCSKRSYYVGDNVLEDDIKAKFNNGVLSVTLPKEKPVAVPEKKVISID